MYLKKLHLHNFKSFAGTIDIPFSPGFTGVAGPNGMGKSNIGDAILFVLGPSSSKALRADRLPRLLFDGGKAGKAATECEVSLTFDNSDRALAVDSDEVEFTRYVKIAPNDPEGYYSYFYVNGHRSTQGEMDALLARARLSADGYNIVQQGEITRIVAISPLERRLLVERLAGIAQYDEELERAGGKREALEGNLAQLSTLLTEVERHLTELDGQRTQAIRHKELSDRKRILEAALAHTNLSRLRGEVASAQKRLEELSSEVEKLKVHLRELREAKEKVQNDIHTVEVEIAQRGGEDALRVKKEMDEDRLAVGRLEMAVENGSAAQKALTDERAQLEKELTTRRKELEELNNKLATLKGEVQEIEGRVTEHAKALEGANASQDLSQKAVELRRSLLVNERNQKAKEEEWHAAVQKIETAKAEASSLEHEKALAEEELAVRRAEVKDLEFRIRSISGSRKGGERSIESLTEELHQLRSRERTFSERAERLKIELLELNRSYAALEARLKERGGSGGSPILAADFLMAQMSLGRLHGLRGKVEDLVQVDPEYATAISIAGGARFQALVVENDEIASQCIELLNKEKKGRVTLLPLNKMVAGRPKGKSLVVQKAAGSRGFALDLVKFDPALESAVWYVFGETLVIDALENARKVMGGVRLVTLRGELIEGSGAITGGYLETAGKSRGAENAATLKRLSEELGGKTSEDAQVSLELKGIAPKIKAITEELARHSAEASTNASAMEEMQKDLARCRERLKVAEERGVETERRYVSASKDSERLEGETRTLQEALAKLKAAHDELQKQYLDNLPSALSSRMKKFQEEGANLTEERVRLHRELEAAKAAFQAATETLKARETDLEQKKEGFAAKGRELKGLAKNLAEARERLSAIEKVAASQTEANKSLMTKKDGLTIELTRLVGEESKMATRLQTQGDVVKEFEIRRDTLERTLEEEEAALKDFPELDPKLQGMSPEELRLASQEATEALVALGAVNTLAIEQYDAEKKRLDEFQAEVVRLKDERDGLMNLVKELEGKKRLRLKEVIDGVDENYRKIYSELSGGGEGELLLEDPKDPLKGGLLIRARPLGKKAQRLEQLSGGEKSLASLAFIFALQRFDPSPLYVLDEVDMSLDGINAENIGRMLRRNSTKAQFIVISLRKVTLKWAEHLFGITMRGDGISQVVGLRIDDIVDVDERELHNVAMREGTEVRVGVEAK